MKIGNCILGLICIVAVTTANGAERYQKMRETTQAAPQVEAEKKKLEGDVNKLEAKKREYKDIGAKAAKTLGAHPKADPVLTLEEISKKIGHDPHMGKPGNTIIQVVEDAKERLSDTQPDIHTAITVIEAMLTSKKSVPLDLTVSGIENQIGGNGTIQERLTHINSLLGEGHEPGVPPTPEGKTTEAKTKNLLTRLKAIPAGHVIVAAPGAVTMEAWLAAQGH
jgi:hypothetical protein